MLQNLKVSFLIWKNTCSHLPAGDKAAELNIFRTQTQMRHTAYHTLKGSWCMFDEILYV